MTKDLDTNLYQRLQAVADSSTNRAERLSELVPELVQLFESAAVETTPNLDPHQDNWLWTSRCPSPESETRGKIVQLLAELGPEAANAIPALRAALGDFAVCRNYGAGKNAVQEHVCYHAVCALGKLGPAAVPVLREVSESEAICYRFFEPFAPQTGDITRLGQLATEILKQQ